MAAGINHHNVHEYVVPAPLHLITNPACKSSPVRLVVATNRPHPNTQMSINDTFHGGLPHVPAIRSVVLMFHFALSLSLSNLSSYYKRNILDPGSSLMPTILLQGDDNSDLLYLDPTRRDKLEL